MNAGGQRVGLDARLTVERDDAPVWECAVLAEEHKPLVDHAEAVHRDDDDPK